MKPDERVRGQVRTWRDELLNLSRRDRVLYYKPTASASLLVEKPGLSEVLDTLFATRGGWDFYYPPSVEATEPHEEPIEGPEPDPVVDPLLLRPPQPNELVTQKRDPKKVENALRLLDRRTTQEFMDKGIWVLYLAAGFLHWIDPDTEDGVRSPILLVPVALKRASPRDPFRLERADEEPVINPALAVRMENDFGVTLPSLDDPDDFDYADVVSKVERAIRGRPWSVRDELAIDVFSFFKEVMYKDLKDNEDTIVESPLVRALALGSSTDVSLGFSPPAETDLDTLFPPEDMATILDADGSQRRCIIAASEGQSFVMDGPPGTGKSQTIANIISQAIHDGRTVLFVSEKVAALEVVKARLDNAGLGAYLLELHSHKAGRKEVAGALAEALLRYPKPLSKLDAGSLERLRMTREELSAYATAMNEVREPLGLSLHGAIGRAVALDDVPRVRAEIDTSLDRRTYQSAVQAAEALSRAWGPVAGGDDFLWRGAVPELGPAAAKQDVEDRIEQANLALARLEGEAGVVARELELWWNESPRSASSLLTVLESLSSRPAVPPEWMTTSDFKAVVQRIDRLKEIVASRTEAADELESHVGDGWAAIDPSSSERVLSATSIFESAGAAWAAVDQRAEEGLESLQQFVETARRSLAKVRVFAGDLAARVGVEVGELTVARACDLADLGQLVGASDRPEVEWLDPLALPRLNEAGQVLGALAASYRAKAEALSGIFTPSVLDLDLERLHARFEDLHRGFRKLGSAYRADKKVLAEATRIGKATREAIAALPAAIEWQQVSNELASAETKHAGLIGDHYYAGPSSDFEAITNAIAVAQQAIELAGRHLADAERFRAQLARGGPAESELPLMASDIRQEVGTLIAGSRTALELDEIPFKTEPIDLVLAQLDQVLVAVTALLEENRSMQGATGLDIDVAGLLTATALRQKIDAFDRSLATTEEDDRAVIGSLYNGLDTKWEDLDGAMEWTKALRKLLGRGVGLPTAERLLASQISPEGLAHVLGEWHEARDNVVGMFDDQHQESVRADLEAGFEDARLLLDGLLGAIPQIDEWLAFCDLRGKMTDLGLGTAVQSLVELNVGADDVAPAVERAMLEGWSDAVLSADPRLKTFRAEDRTALVEDFRNLDRRLIRSAAGRVMTAANSRRPQTAVGAAGTIQREGTKKRRHMPVRELIAQTSEVTQSLKPCFMMSPLSVSQFLTADIRFDLVIFDEASQVKPSDAVNCVYRGRQLVVAGDQKQLPPTTFFESSIDTGDEYEEDQFDEFESVLDLAKAGGMESLPLRWHYRSQHESLITYSNYSFYEGRLVTFPGALAEAPDVGLECYFVEGEYRRGGNRDNPVEAEKVAERVLFHAENHPHLTLGVVAFSEAQASTIQYVIERHRRGRPELDAVFDDDRLTGFFVKNLENVQGDERDIMIFSIGYGPDEAGKITMNFGPLNKKGGERRLNVAITRARRRVEVVSSLHPSDFQLTASEGPRHLQRYLDFITRGMPALAVEVADGARGAESPFEEEVAKVLSSWGLDVHLQVGVAEYRIDIAVADPARPGAFLLGVECDGAMYHSSRVARDRDRLRQEVLERLGWRIHRIWGPAWYRNRKGEQERLRAAIEEAMTGKPSAAPRSARKSQSPPKFVEVELNEIPSWAADYTISRPPVARHYEMHDPSALPTLTRAVEAVVAVESPVHAEVVLRRIRGEWGVGRAGNRIREAFDTAVMRAQHAGAIRIDHKNFLWSPDSEAVTVRTPTHDPESQRRVSEVADEEIEAAIVALVRDAKQATWDEVSTGVARILGWARRGRDIDQALEDSLSRLIDAGVLVRNGVFLVPPGEPGVRA